MEKTRTGFIRYASPPKNYGGQTKTPAIPSPSIYGSHILTKPNLKSLPDMVLDGDEPIFNEPWEAQAFAMAINLHQKGLFTWEEWAAALTSEIHGGTEREYYNHWLAALEKLATSKNLTSIEAIETRKKEWHAAAARTPHGEPIIVVNSF